MSDNLEKEHKKFEELIKEWESDPENKQLVDEVRVWMRENIGEIFLKNSENRKAKSLWDKLKEVGVTEIQELHFEKYVPLSKELVITGGDDFEVAKVLYENVRWPGVAYLIGNRKINVDGFNIYFSRKED